MKVTKFRYGSIHDISSEGVFLTSVFITAFYPARGVARGQGGNGSATPPVPGEPTHREEAHFPVLHPRVDQTESTHRTDILDATD